MRINLDLTRLKKPDIYILLAPFLPGCLLLGAVVYRNFGIAVKFSSSRFLGYYMKVLCFAIIGYLLGYMMMFLANMISFIIADTILPYVPNRTWQNKPWDRLEWRKLARRFIGSDVTPKTDLPFAQDKYETLLAAAKQIVDPVKQNSQITQLMEARLALLSADSEWCNWYFILRQYVADENALRETAFGHQLVYLFHACGLAGLAALTLVPEARNGFLWLLFGSASLFGVIYPFAVKYNSGFTPAWDNLMSAQMLRLLHSEQNRFQSNQAQVMSESKGASTEITTE